MAPKSSFAAAATAVLALTSSVVAAPSQSVVERDDSGPSLTTQLTIADSTVDKFNLLKDEDFVFDFKTGPLAYRKNFPALSTVGGAMAYASLPACGMVALHQHLRANELFVVTSGKIYSEMDHQDRAHSWSDDDLPQGTLHTQVNMQCENASAVASFTSDDPGTIMVLPKAFTLTDGLVQTSFGTIFEGKDIDSVRQALPSGALIMVEECLKRCNMTKN
uniref:Cupin type-1 domain-containing protein n=1 Tax=Bionectria ochroleuca TaxID=29856 RepID=A0A8H7NIK0_BIOOC